MAFPRHKGLNLNKRHVEIFKAMTGEGVSAPGTTKKMGQKKTCNPQKVGG